MNYEGWILELVFTIDIYIDYITLTTVYICDDEF